MKKLLLKLIFVHLIFLGGMFQMSFAQVTGDYRTVATGNWDAIATWETFDGAVWAAASTKPGANNNVFIETPHIITLTANEACRDLNINTTTSRCQLASFVLELNGKLRAFTGAAPGTSAALGSAYLIQQNAGGSIKVVGNSRALTSSGEWGAGSGTANANMPDIEIALNANQTVTAGTNIKFGNWTFTSGTFNANTFSVSADAEGASANTRPRNISIGPNAEVISSATSTTNVFQKTGATAIGGTLTIDGKLVLLGTAPLIQANNKVINNTSIIEYGASGNQTFAMGVNPPVSSGTATVPISVYPNLVLSGSGTKTLGTNTTVNLSYTINGTASLALGGFTFTDNTATDILTFDFTNPAAVGVVDAINHTVTLSVPAVTDRSALIPTITLSAGASISPLSGVAADFTSPKSYTVTAQNGTSTQVWTVTVNLAAATETNILSYSITGQSQNAVIDNNARTIAVTMPYGTNPNGLIATFTLSSGASTTVSSVAQVSGVTANNFTSPVVYNVLAQDAITNLDWTVTVTIAPNTATDILTFNFTTPAATGTVNATNHTIALTLPFGTVVTALVPTITLSAGATVSPLSDIAADFTAPVIYTVTAQDGTTIQAWTATVTLAAQTFDNQAGDYRSVASGNWDAIATWERFDGSTWLTATEKPGASNSVYIQSGHVVTLTQPEACKDLAFAKQTTAPAAAQGAVQLKNFVLEVNGRLACFTTLSPITYGTPTNLGNSWPLQTDAGTGTIKVVGDSRALTVTGGWGAGSGTSNGTMPNIEIALNAGQTVTLGSNIKFANWTLSSGTLDASTYTVSADAGSTNLKDITILSGATFKSSSAGNIFQRTSSTAMGIFSINTGGTMILSGATPKIQASTITMNGTVEYNAAGDQFLLARGSIGVNADIYSTLILSTSGVKKLVVNTTVNSVYIINGTASMDLNGYTFTNNAGTDVATLADLKVNGTSIPGFDKNTLSYNIVLDYGTVAVPAVTYTTSSEKATALLTDATGLPGTSTILVTAENGTTQLTYSLNFTVASTPSTDATLKDLKVGGITVEGFLSSLYEYQVVLPFGTVVPPQVTATLNSGVASMVITQAQSMTDMAFVLVTAQDGTTQLTYSIIFSTNDYIYTAGFEATGNDLVPFPGWTTNNTIVSTNWGTLPIVNHGQFSGSAAFRFICGKSASGSTSGWLKTIKYPKSGILNFWLYVQESDGNEQLLVHKKVKGATDSVLVATLTSANMTSTNWKEFTIEINESDSTSIIITSVLTIDGLTRIWMDDLSLKGKLSTGISKFDIESPMVKLFPNPVSELLTVDMKQAQYQTIEIYNTAGARLLSQKITAQKFDLNVVNLKEGVYFIKFRGENMIYNSKFIKF